MKLFFRFTVLKVGQRDLYRGKCIYLVRRADLGQPAALRQCPLRRALTTLPSHAPQCNHRSWADFMVDQYVTEGRSLFMSRWGAAADHAWKAG